MNIYVLRGLFFLGWMLSVILIMVFLPLSTTLKGLSALALTALCLLYLSHSLVEQKRRRIRASQNERQGILPPPNYLLPIVLVTGDELTALFGDEESRDTSDGFYLKVGNLNQLYEVVQQIIDKSPNFSAQISCLHIMMPEIYIDNENLKSEVREWRWQINQINKKIGITPTTWISCYFSSPVEEMEQNGLGQYLNAGAPLDSRVWIFKSNKNSNLRETLSSQFSNIEIIDVAGQNVNVGKWIMDNSPSQTKVNFSKAIYAETAFIWLLNEILTECNTRDRVIKPIHLASICINYSDVSFNENNIWLKTLSKYTALSLRPSIQNYESTSLFNFPDFMLKRLPHNVHVTPVEQGSYGVIFLVAIFLSLATTASYWNNKTLINDVAFEIHEYMNIASDDREAQLVGLENLKEISKKLDLYYKEGEPAELSLFLYQGLRLAPPVKQLIAAYKKPAELPMNVPIMPPPVQEVLYLDTVSLFDVGKSNLKENSSKKLIEALVNIKAKNGYVIFISGHTDNTGLKANNELLSLRRAEAVRDWMMNYSDIPLNCFAVQGYGSDKPLAENDTEEGRLKNRRVEISLIPSKDACN